MSAEIDALKAEIVSLETARTNLISGKQVAEVSSDQGTVKYTKGSLKELGALIQSKKSELSRLQGGRSARYRMIY